MNANELIESFLKTSDYINDNINLKQYRYTFLDTDSVQKIKSVEMVQKIYFEEILYRSHLAGVCSWHRNYTWLKGVCSAMKDNNFLSFASTFRGLFESSADNLYSLLNVPSDIADNFDVIKNALQCKPSGELYKFPDLENALIHFSEARTISKTEKASIGTVFPEWNAKTVKEYISNFDKDKTKPVFYDLYSLLCQFTHPSAYSVHYMFEKNIIGDKYIYSYKNDSDDQLIQWFMGKYNDLLIQILRYGFNPGITILKTLNFFGIENISTPCVEKIEFVGNKIWKDIQAKLSK